MAVTALSSGSSQSLIEEMKERRAALKAMEEAVRTGDLASAKKSLATLQSTSSKDGSNAATDADDASNPFRATMKADLSALTAAVAKGDLSGAQSALQTLDADKAKFTPPSFAQYEGTDDTQGTGQGGFLDDLQSLLKAVKSGDSDGVKLALASLQNDLQSFMTQADTQANAGTDATADATQAGSTTTSQSSFADDIKALMDAAKSGDTKAMQEAARKVAGSIDDALAPSGTHHGHHHMHAASTDTSDTDAATGTSAAGSSGTSSTAASGDTTQAEPESSMLRNAREAYAQLMSFGNP